MTEQGVIIKGYKATNENMQCRNFQFELGVWYEHEGDIALCEQGFHFCEYPSGPYAYYPEGRMFTCEAEYVIESDEPGASRKHVAKRIRLVDELTPDGHDNPGDRNTGNRNTGNRNTGNRNTGNRNTGHGNTGYRNTGDRNAGNRNTGDRNTGHDNTGHGNTGYRNTGDRNTGDRNSGHDNTGDRNAGNRNAGNRNSGHDNTGDRNAGNRNTGDRNSGHDNTGDRNSGHDNTGDRNSGHDNTGDRNTGDGNVGDRHSGSLCYGEAPFFLFNLPADRDSTDHFLVSRLVDCLHFQGDIDPTPFLSLPNATPERIKALHDAHKEARSQKCP